MKELAAIALAGALGSISRYSVSRWAYETLGPSFVYGTLAVNVVGCFALGFLMQVGASSDGVPGPLRLALTTGFLGAFTTFSTFGYETVRYVEDGALALAAINVGANVGVGLAAAWAGMASARVILA